MTDRPTCDEVVHFTETPFECCLCGKELDELAADYTWSRKAAGYICTRCQPFFDLEAKQPAKRNRATYFTVIALVITGPALAAIYFYTF